MSVPGVGGQADCFIVAPQPGRRNQGAHPTPNARRMLLLHL
ncbi:hypothetical protein M2352_004959 [Azospirillum fermentarium]|nr:hypothetical protein [Azospirillum fermentarium]